MQYQNTKMYFKVKLLTTKNQKNGKCKYVNNGHMHFFLCSTSSAFIT